MKRTVWTFGLIAGAIMSAMMVITLPMADRIGFDTAEVLGYTTIIAAFLLIFFGIRSYRDNQAGRRISFGRALLVGTLINIVASACYVATWQVIYQRIGPEFMERMAAHQVEEMRADGATDAQIAAKQAQLQKFAELYKNPLVNAAVTFLEPFSVGLIVALVSAGILRRRRNGADALADGVADGLTRAGVF
jgi:amino acid transporter